MPPDSSNEELRPHLWPIVREIIKTAIENQQNLIVEGCYIPIDYKNDFEDYYLEHISFICLIFSRSYIENHYDQILAYENVIEQRAKAGNHLGREQFLSENLENLALCRRYARNYVLFEQGDYERILEDWLRSVN